MFVHQRFGIMLNMQSDDDIFLVLCLSILVMIDHDSDCTVKAVSITISGVNVSFYHS